MLATQIYLTSYSIMFSDSCVTYVHRRLRLPHLVYQNIGSDTFRKNYLRNYRSGMLRAVLTSAESTQNIRRTLQFADRMRWFTDNI